MTNFNPNVPFAQAIRNAQTLPAIYDLYREVMDSLQRRVYQSVIADNAGMDISNLPGGQYYLRFLETGGRFRTAQFVKH